MNRKIRLFITMALSILAVAVLTAIIWAAPGKSRLTAGGSPTVVAYQGEVRVSGAPHTGDGTFKFAVVDVGGSTYWSNDGSSTAGSEPAVGVTLAVSEGLFGVLLGDTTLAGMTQALTADVFDQPDRYLRVWFSTSVAGPFELLVPDTRIAAVPYALQAQEAVDADTVDGLHANQLRTHYQNVIVVAKSGGEYNSVQAAIDSCNGAAADNPYLVWVAPGVYEEQVTMKPYVHMQGAGQDATVITSTVGNAGWPPTQATLVLTRATSLRDLTVGNSGADDSNVSLLAMVSVTRTLVEDVTVLARGGGLKNYAIVLSGSGTGVTLQQITAVVENGSVRNYGLINHSGAVATLHGGTFTGRGGDVAIGILNMGSGTTLDGENISTLGENGSTDNYGLLNIVGAATTLNGGSFTGRGGVNTFGIANNDSGTTLNAQNVSALADNGSGQNYGLGNYISATATLRGGDYTARGGAFAYGITNGASSTMLSAENVVALGENASDTSHGFFNFSGADAVLQGGSFTGQGGVNTDGICNTDSGSTLKVKSVNALGEGGSVYNYGLYNDAAAIVALQGGSFIARRGSFALGIQNSGASTSLVAVNISTLAENAFNLNEGLHNDDGAVAVVRDSSFIARGGLLYTRGIYNKDGNSVLKAQSVTALAENGWNMSYGLANSGSNTIVSLSVLGGATKSVASSTMMTVSNSRLVGGPVDGTVTCVLVTRGTSISTDGASCP